MRLGAGVLLLAVVAASPEVRYFRYERPVETMPQRAGQTCMALDAGIYAHGLPQLADLRLYRDGNETPYVIRDSAPAAGAEKTIALLNLGAQGGQTVFDAETAGQALQRPAARRDGTDFIATVTVTGSRTKGGSAERSWVSYTISI